MRGFLCGSVLDYLNPLHWTSADKMMAYWHWLLANWLFGWGAKTLSIALLLYGFWLLARRENFLGFFGMAFLSFFFAYIGGMLKLLGFGL